MFPEAVVISAAKEGLHSNQHQITISSHCFITAETAVYMSMVVHYQVLLSLDP